MITAAICDDDIKICAELESALGGIFDGMQVEYEIEVYFTCAALCRSMESGSHYDLIFLDIEFAEDEINGVEAGRLIREAQQNHMVSIVYISQVRDYSLQLFEIRPLNFLIKPLKREAIEKTVSTFLKITKLWEGEFSYSVGRDTHKIKLSDVIYLESRDRKVILHLTRGKTAEFYASLKEIYQDQLKEYDFLFIHASYAVNFDHISAIRYDRLFLADGEAPLPISQGRRNEIRERFSAIMKRRRI